MLTKTQTTPNENLLVWLQQLQSDLVIIQSALALVDEPFIHQQQLTQELQGIAQQIKAIMNNCLEEIPSMSICDTDWYSW